MGFPVKAKCCRSKCFQGTGWQCKWVKQPRYRSLSLTIKCVETTFTSTEFVLFLGFIEKWVSLRLSFTFPIMIETPLRYISLLWENNNVWWLSGADTWLSCQENDKECWGLLHTGDHSLLPREHQLLKSRVLLSYRNGKSFFFLPFLLFLQLFIFCLSFFFSISFFFWGGREKLKS